MSNSNNTGFSLYKVTSFFTLTFLVMAAGFITYSIHSYSQQKPEKQYLSAVDMRILNHVIAPSIVPASQQVAEEITPTTVTKALSQHPACQAEFTETIKIELLAQRLLNLQNYVGNYTSTPKVNNQTPYVFSLQKWTDRACNMLNQVEENTKLHITASHISSTLKQISKSKDLLAQGNAYWCEKYPQQQSCNTPEYYVQFSEKILAVANPWSGLKGCLLLGDPQSDYYYLSGRKGNSQINDNISKVCSAITQNSEKTHPVTEQNLDAVALDDPTWILPPSYANIIQPMQALRQVQSLYAPTEQGEFIDIMEKNTVKINDKEQPIGLHTELTIQPQTQKITQQIAMCYTGHQKICDDLGLSNAVKNQEFYEDAVVRKVGIVVLDIKTGELEALASAHSRCFEQNSQGSDGGKDCPIPSYTIQVAPDKLRNHAYFDEAPPASTMKPLMAVTFLQDAANQDVEALGVELALSDSNRFLRRMLCLNGSGNWKNCTLPQQMQKTAIAMGWDSNCYNSNEAIDPKNKTYDCGKLDTLWGKQSPVDLGDYNRDKLADKANLYGWFMVKKQGNPKTLRTDFNFTVDPNRPTADESWYTKQTYSVKDLTNQGLGQGESLSTPVGVAGMIANLALAAQQQTQQVLPHVVRRIFDVEGKTPPLLEATKADNIPITLPSDKAHIVITKMQGSHQIGTARKACISAFDANTCKSLTTIAGKTGTPTISDEKNTQTVLKRRQEQQNDGKPCQSNCTYPPYKWYVAAYQSQGKSDQPYDKVMAVLVERNWNKKGSLTPDKENNHAAEIAFRVFKNLGAVTVAEPAPQRSKK